MSDDTRGAGSAGMPTATVYVVAAPEIDALVSRLERAAKEAVSEGERVDQTYQYGERSGLEYAAVIVGEWADSTRVQVPDAAASSPPSTVPEDARAAS